jgi:SAM-dependent methyltransferase
MTTEPHADDRAALAFRDFEHAGWERAAPAYERHWDRLTAGTLPRLLERLGAGPGVQLLDVACGHGAGVAAALDRGATVTGADFSGQMLSRAQRRAPGARLLMADAEALPFPDGHFDTVLCNFGLLHFARPEAALREMARVLRPGGRLGVTVWASLERMRLLGVVREAVAAAATAPDLAPPGPDFFQHADPERFRVALVDADLTEIGVERVPLIYSLPDVQTLWELVAEGSVRTAALLRSQPAEVLSAIRQRITRDLEPYRDPSGNGYRLPADAMLAYGTKGR